MYNNNILSRTITFLRFPMIVAVVMLHTIIVDQNNFGVVQVPHGKYPIFDICQYLLQRDLGDIAVPLFFFVSGFLFFYKVDVFNWNTYSKKIKKRVHSLLIPYLIWNTLFLLFIVFCYYCFPSIVKSFHPLLSKFNFIYFVKSYWNVYSGPILAPMWFIRDLMVLNLFTPFIYLLIKKTDFLIVFLATILFISGWKYTLPGIGGRIWLPYILGAYFSINKMNFLNEFYKIEKTLYFLCVMFILLDVLLFHFGKQIVYINHTAIILGIICVPLMVAKLINKNIIHENSFLATASFFVFGFHMFFINIFNKSWVFFLHVNTFTAIFVQIFIPILVSIVCVGVYILLKKIMPRFSNLLVGNRQL